MIVPGVVIAGGRNVAVNLSIAAADIATVTTRHMARLIKASAVDIGVMTVLAAALADPIPTSRLRRIPAVSPER